MIGPRARFDVLVIGGGPAGLVTAAEVAVRGFTVCVCEAREGQEQRIGEVLPAIAKPLLAEIGVLDRLTGDPSAACASLGRVSAWGSTVPVEGASITNPFGSGWYLDRVRFESMLAQNAVERGARHLGGARVSSVEQPSSATWRVQVRAAAEEISIESRVVVDATGRTAWLSRRLGAVQQRVDRLIGLGVRCAAPGRACPPRTGADECRVSHPTDASRESLPRCRPSDPMLLVEAIEAGWWYSVPQPNADLVVVLMTDADLCRPSMSQWERALGEAPLTSARTDGLVRRSRAPRVHLAHSARTRLPVPRAIAVGDAAAAFDPLSSDGLCFALRSGVEAARAIGQTLKRGTSGAGPGEAYESAVDRIFERYLARRTEFYNTERRWVSAPFWSRRRDAPPAPA